MATSKLNYASIRSAQRKNKSMHEAKDLLPKHMQTNYSHYTNLAPPFPLDQPTKPFKDRISKGKVGYSLFEDIPVGEKNGYAKTLFGKYKEEPVRQEEKIAKGHYRVKSSITEMYHKSPEILEEDERTPSGATFGRFDTNSNRGVRVNYDTLHVNDGAGGMVARLEEDYRIARERGKENKMREERVHGILGLGQVTKEGRMLSDFLKKDGGFGKETASPEEMRPRKKELSPGHEQGGDSIDKKIGVRLFGERSPKNISIEDNLSPNGDFITKLDNYIDYFKKSERSHRRASKGGNEYFVEDRGKSHEEGVRDNEMKMMKKQMEGLNSKMNEVMKANKKILKEFSKMLMREDEYSQRIIGLEEEFTSLRKKNKRYREKLKVTTHLLEKEKTENENNLLALRKVLSKSEKQNDLESLIIKSGVNLVLENKIRKYVDDHRDNKSKYENMLREGSADSGHKRREDKLDRNELKERKSSDKRHSIRKDDPMFAQKISLFSDDPYFARKTQRREIEEDDDDNEDEEDKLNTIEQEEDELYSTSPDKQENKYRKDNLWSPPRHKRSTESAKEHQIRILQERLSDLMEGREYSSKYGAHDKVINQVWPRNIDSGLLNTNKQSKQRNQSKHSMDANHENGYGQNIRERQGSHPKMNSFHSRGESGFE